MRLTMRSTTGPAGSHSFRHTVRDLTKDLTRYSLLAVMAALNMGNESCEKAQDTRRVLKMDVEISQMRGKNVQLPNGEIVDFPYVLNALFYRQVMNNRHFLINNEVPMVNGPAVVGVGLTKAARGADEIEIEGGTDRDLEVLASFGFIDQMVEQVIEQQQLSASPADQASEMSLKSEAASALQAAAKIPACVINAPQAKLAGEMISFEVHYGGGLSLGYNGGTTQNPGGVGGSFNFESSKLQLGLRTDDPLTRNVMVIGDGVATNTKFKFGFSFAAGLPIGLDFFFNTPLANTIKSAMDKALAQIVTSYKTMISTRKNWDDVWESRVIYDPVISDNDTHVAIKAGYRANVQVGDRFHITNMRYGWEAAECTSRLKYKIAQTTAPIALAEIVSVGDNVAVARLTSLMDQIVFPGALVEIESLHDQRAGQPDGAQANKNLAKR